MKSFIFNLILSVATLTVAIFNYFSMKAQGVFSEFFWVNIIIALTCMKNVFLTIYSRGHHKNTGASVKLFNLICDTTGLVLILLGYKKSFSSLLWLGVFYFLAVVIDAISYLRFIERQKH